MKSGKRRLNRTFKKIFFVIALTLVTSSCYGLQLPLSNLNAQFKILSNSLTSLKSNLETLKNNLEEKGRLPRLIPISYSADGKWIVLLGHDADYSGQWDAFAPSYALPLSSQTLSAAMNLFNGVTKNCFANKIVSRPFGPFDVDEKNGIYSYYFVPVGYVRAQILHATQNISLQQVDGFVWAFAHDFLTSEKLFYYHWDNIKGQQSILVFENFHKHFKKIWKNALLSFNDYSNAVKIASCDAIKIRFFYDDNPAKHGANDYNKYFTKAFDVWIDALDLFSFLGNFYPSPITISISNTEYTFPNAEAAFQAHKAHNPQEIEPFTQVTSGYEAIILKNSIKMTTTEIDEWDKSRYSIMKKIVIAKFRQNPILAAQLKATGNAILIEWTTNDDTWGIIRDYHNPNMEKNNQKALNWLGKILMEVRSELL